MKRVPELDGMRGVAILAVAFFHWPLYLIPQGWLGVDIFFVLSGYLITSILFSEYQKRERIDFRVFYLRRALRLAPALLVFLAGFSAFHLLHRNTPYPLTTVLPAVLFYYANWARAFDWQIPLGYAGHTWSLSVEEHFYMVWPLAVLLLCRRVKNRNRISHFILLAIALSAALRAYFYWQSGSYLRGYYGSDTRADALLIGGLVAVMSINQAPVSVPRFGLALLGLLWLGLFFFAPVTQAPFYYYGGFTAVAASVGIFLVWLRAEGESVPKTVLQFRPLVWLGQISYGFYLWHVLAIGIASRFASSDSWIMLGSLTVTLAAATASYYFVEVPFLRLKDRIAKNRGAVPDLESRSSGVEGVAENAPAALDFAPPAPEQRPG